MVGFTAEGQIWDGDQPVQGLHLKHREHVVAQTRRRRRDGRPADRGRGQSDPAVVDHAVAAADGRLRRSANLPARSGRARGRAPRRRSALLRPARAVAAARHDGPQRDAGRQPAAEQPAVRGAGPERGPLGGAAGRAHRGVRSGRRRRRRRIGRSGAHGVGARARAEGRGRRAEGERGRARAHRLGVAVAGPRDEAQVRAHLLECAAPHGGLPGVPVLRVAGAAVRVDEGALPVALRAHPGPGGGGPVRADRQHVGGGRLQHPVGRVPRPPDRARQAVLHGRVRPRDHRPLAPRRVRLLGGPAADPRRGGGDVVRDAEDVVERDEPVPAQHVLVGGHRRHAHARALPARRHLQRRHERARGSEGRPAVRAEGRVTAVAVPVRVRGRRRGTDAGDAGIGAPHAGSRRCAARRDGHRRVVLGRGSGGGARRAGLGRRALPRVPPGHVHDQRSDQAREPGERARAARRRAVVGRGGRDRRLGRVSRRDARRVVEAAAAEPVPRHHPGLEHPLGQRGEPPRPRARRRGRVRARGRPRSGRSSNGSTPRT